MNRPDRIRRYFVFVCVACLSACKTSDDATAAAKQLATTSVALTNYYGALLQVTSGSISLGNLQNALLPHGNDLPFPENNRTLLNATASELQKRAGLAKSLQDVSTAFSNLTSSTAPVDVSNAASSLATELNNVKALPTPSGSPIPIPSAIGGASRLLVSLIEQHQARKAAPALDATGNALKELFSTEQQAGAYDSLYHTYLTKAASLAKYSIDRNMVDESSVLRPALQPFNLSGNISENTDTAPLKIAAKSQIDDTEKTLDAAHQEASAAMLQALTEMSARLHQLATEGRMPSRGVPVTLTTVENWLSTVSTYIPASTGTQSAAKTPGASSSTNKKQSKQ